MQHIFQQGNPNQSKLWTIIGGEILGERQMYSYDPLRVSKSPWCIGKHQKIKVGYRFWLSLKKKKTKPCIALVIIGFEPRGCRISHYQFIYGHFIIYLFKIHWILIEPSLNPRIIILLITILPMSSSSVLSFCFDSLPPPEVTTTLNF